MRPRELLIRAVVLAATSLLVVFLSKPFVLGMDSSKDISRPKIHYRLTCPDH